MQKRSGLNCKHSRAKVGRLSDKNLTRTFASEISKSATNADRNKLMCAHNMSCQLRPDYIWSIARKRSENKHYSTIREEIKKNEFNF